MYELKKHKFIIIFIFTVLIIICFCIILGNNSYQNNQIIIKEQINISNIVKDRYIFQDIDTITIGRNSKEIENGYYDVMIKYDKQTVKVFFNKLYKEEYSKNLYVDEKYLFEILTLINLKFEFGLDERKLQELVVLISDNYINYKNNICEKDNIENSLNDKYDYEINFVDSYLIFNIKIKD